MCATWVLVAVVLTVKYHYSNPDSTLGPAAVSLTLFAAISWSAGTTGACLNPAIGIANSVLQYMIRDQLSASMRYSKPTLDSLWVYIVAPSVGGVLAGLFQLLNGKAEK